MASAATIDRAVVSSIARGARPGVGLPYGALDDFAAVTTAFENRTCLFLLMALAVAVTACPRGVPAQPVRSPSGTFVFRSDRMQLEIDPTRAGRVLRFGSRETNLLIEASFVAHADDAAGRNQFGSTFWISPQSMWKWPPEAAVDRQPYRAQVSDGALVLTGEPGAHSRISVEKHIELGAAPDRVTFRYTMRNQGPSRRKVAPWEVSRVPQSGLVFFPSVSSPLASSTLQSAGTEGAAWLDFSQRRTKSAKLFQDGREGWLAYVAFGLVFVKVFPDISQEQAAPGEAEVEIYVSEDGYIELEQQGACVELEPDQQSPTWKVEWVVRRLPARLRGHVRVGSKQLLAWVRSLVSG